MKARLIKRSVEKIMPSARAVFLWDTEIPGFGVKVTPQGRRVYVLQYSYGGRSRRYTIGRHGIDVTADEARTEARSLRGQVADGHDPAGDRATQRNMPTLKEFAERYLTEHAAVKKKPRSMEGDKCNLQRHILPTLGRRKVTEIARADVARLHAAMRNHPTTANRCLSLLSKMFNLAEKWGYRPDGTNPTRHIDKYPERRIERFLSEVELARLGDVLDGAEQAGEHPSVVAAIRLLIFTGCRRNEILTLKWEHVDFERGCLRLPDSKTGAQMVPLGAPAIELLSGLSRIEGNPYVLPGAVPGRHYVALEKAWRRLRGKAGLDDVRLHDLRHSFASTGAAAGESLVLIGALLGHSNPATTARYAHLSNDPLKAAADRIAGRIAGAMSGKPGDVVALSGSRK